MSIPGLPRIGFVLSVLPSYVQNRFSIAFVSHQFGADTLSRPVSDVNPKVPTRLRGRVGARCDPLFSCSSRNIRECLVIIVDIRILVIINTVLQATYTIEIPTSAR